MRFLEQRQKIVAENIANADTPNYRAKDLKNPDFSHLLKATTAQSALNISSPSLARTDRGHIGRDGASPLGDEQKAREQKRTYEVAPDGNAVIIEEQLMRASEIMTDHRLMTNLYQKNIDLIKTALREGN
jgi:flagellar basal-body rod protein FlgB